MKLAVFAFLVSLTLSMFALAQQTSQLTGRVSDPSGASIVKAQVTASSAERGIQRATQTNGDGDYLISSLPPGTYDLTIKASGFKTYEAQDIVQRVAQKARADATLQVGA